MRDTDSISGLIELFVRPLLKYMVPREGQVQDTVDPAGKGRILVTIPAFGWDTNEKGAWCYTADKNAITTIKKGDWVVIQFVDGNSDFPICLGKSTRIKDQIPKNYDGKATTHVIFEDPDNKIHMKYDGSEMEIGNSEFKAVARVDDTTIVDNITDTAFITWISQVSAAINTLAPGSISSVPTSVAGKIDSGSDQIKVGNK